MSAGKSRLPPPSGVRLCLFASTKALTGPIISIAVQPLPFVIWAFTHLYFVTSAGCFSNPLSERA
eukprot:9710357-Heterocapsa_arctica.AAC.1